MRPVTTASRTPRPTWLLPVLGAVIVSCAACGGSTTALTSTTTTLPATTTTIATGSTTTTVPNQRSYPLYFLRGAQLGVSQRAVTLASDTHYQAITALMGGTDPVENAAGLTTEIPPGTTVRGLAIRTGIATVNLSPQFVAPGSAGQLSARLAQVVYTLTSTPTVTAVVIEVGGNRIVNFAGVDLSNPVGRNQVTASLPLVLLEQPAVGGSLKGTLTISGRTTGTGTYDVQLLDPTGKLLASVTNSAVSGGTFVQSVPFSITAPETGTVRVYGRPTSASIPVQVFQFNLPIAP